jgi:hypothetical protein
MADKKADVSTAPSSGDPARPNKRGLSAKSDAGPHSAGAEHCLDTRFHRTFKVSVAAREKRAVMVEVSAANGAGNCLLPDVAICPISQSMLGPTHSARTTATVPAFAVEHASSAFGTSGIKSWSRFECAARTTIATSNPVRFC